MDPIGVFVGICGHSNAQTCCSRPVNMSGELACAKNCCTCAHDCFPAMVTASDLTRESGTSISTSQPNTFTSTKSPSKKQKSNNIHNGLSSAAAPAQSPDIPPSRASSGDRPFRRYSRRTLVALSKSPLVVIPAGMPALKDWFGCVECDITSRTNH